MDRLTKLIKPKKIFMGEKDYQQLFLVKRFIKKKHNSNVIACKTVRNSNKLALSSRNILLNSQELKVASKIAQNLSYFKKKLKKIKDIQNLLNEKKNELNNTFNVRVEYLELRNSINLKKANKIKNSRIFISYYLNKVRLIDNY